jgi:DNA-directed RNA polymerase specialized sigma24 family protein
MQVEIWEAPMSLSPSEQSALLARARQGDNAAFDVLYAAIEQGVYGYIRTLTWDDHEARAIAQDTRLSFFLNGMKHYDPEGGRSLLSFVKASARWVTLNALRENGARRRVELLLSELASRHPELDHEAEFADFLAYESDAATPDTQIQSLDIEHERFRAEVQAELFEFTFTHGTSPPHHLIALGFHIWPDRPVEKTGKRTPARKPSPVWPPRRIVAELSDTTLTTLTGQLEDGLVHGLTYLDETRIRACLRELRQRMAQSVHAILMQLHLNLPPWSVAVALHYGSGVRLTDNLGAQNRAVILDILQHCRVGTTMFRHYYTTQKPEDDIGHWREEVKRQVRQAIRTHGKGQLFVRLQQAEAHKQREAARRAQTRQQQRHPLPSQALGDASRR